MGDSCGPEMLNADKTLAFFGVVNCGF